MTDAEANSKNTPKRSPMQLVAEKQVPDPPTTLSSLIQAQTTTSKPPPPPSQEYVTRAAWRAGVLGAINVLAVVLAIRFILLIATIGAIMLAWAVLKAPDPVAWPTLVVLIGYSAFVVCPIVWLSSHR